MLNLFKFLLINKILKMSLINRPLILLQTSFMLYLVKFKSIKNKIYKKIKLIIRKIIA